MPLHLSLTATPTNPPDPHILTLYKRHGSPPTYTLALTHPTQLFTHHTSDAITAARWTAMTRCLDVDETRHDWDDGTGDTTQRSVTRVLFDDLLDGCVTDPAHYRAVFAAVPACRRHSDLTLQTRNAAVQPWRRALSVRFARAPDRGADRVREMWTRLHEDVRVKTARLACVVDVVCERDPAFVDILRERVFESLLPPSSAAAAVAVPSLSSLGQRTCKRPPSAPFTCSRPTRHNYAAQNRPRPTNPRELRRIIQTIVDRTVTPGDVGVYDWPRDGGGRPRALGVPARDGMGW